MANVPSDLKYAKSHEWVRVAGDVATVGITDHAQHELTDVVFVELPEVGRADQGRRRLRGGGVGQDGERHLLAGQRRDCRGQHVGRRGPGAGEQRALYAAGWFYKIKLSNPAELNALLTPEQYQAQIGGA